MVERFEGSYWAMLKMSGCMKSVLTKLRIMGEGDDTNLDAALRVERRVERKPRFECQHSRLNHNKFNTT